MRLRVTDQQDQEAWTGSLRDFLAANTDTFSDEDIMALAAMQPGDRYIIGGGAAPAFTVERMED